MRWSAWAQVNPTQSVFLIRTSNPSVLISTDSQRECRAAMVDRSGLHDLTTSGQSSNPSEW
jgi:hypothetical protein